MDVTASIGITAGKGRKGRGNEASKASKPANNRTQDTRRWNTVGVKAVVKREPCCSVWYDRVQCSVVQYSTVQYWHTRLMNLLVRMGARECRQKIAHDAL